MKIEVKNVKFKNVLCFGNRMQELDFLKGLNLVIGHNKATGRSNGSGKSSFISLILLGLYGRTEKNLTKAGIVNTKNRKNSELILEFSKGADTYVITRAIKPDKFEILYNGSPVPSVGKTELQTFLEEEILGIDFKTISNTAFTNANSLIPVLKMKKEQKRDLLERIFDLSYFTKLNKVCNTKSGSINEKIRESNFVLSHVSEILEECYTDINALNTKIDNIGTSKIEYEEKVQKKERFENLSKELEEGIRSSIELRENLEKKRLYYQNIIQSIDNTINRLHIKSKYMREKTALEKEVEENKKRLQVLKTEQESLSVENTTRELDEQKDSIKSIETSISSVLTEKQRCDTIIAEQNGTLKHLMSVKDKLDGNAICPTCGAAVDHDHMSEEIEKQEIHLENLHEELRINWLVQSIRELEDEHSQSKARISELEETLRHIRRLDEKIQSFQHIDKLADDISLAKIKLERYKRSEEKLNVARIRYVVDENSLSGQIDYAKKTEQDNTSKLEKVEIWLKELEVLKNKMESEALLRKELESNIESQQKKIDEYLKQTEMENNNVKKSKSMLDHIDLIKEVCKDDHVKQYAITSKIPFINERTNYYLSKVGTGFFVKFDKWMDCEIRGPGMHDFTYANLSSGESRSLDLALQIALLDRVYLQSSVFPDILVFDELLDGSVDNHGIKHLMEIIAVKQKDEDNKTFVISHRSEVGDFDFDNVYYVEKENNGFSTVRIL